MSKILTAAVLLASLAAAGSAEAACNTAALAGKWSIAAASGTLCTITVTTAGVTSGTCSGFSAAGKLALSSACKLSGTVLGGSITGRTEVIATTSPLKPNLMLGLGGGIIGPFAAYRQ
ncbi:hypothetical protein [Oharaeibacter diazotrophicus]|uniref:Uncharacterized protein n=1 Tax=Oharaeibacter diazotrophicus TaxID=1920512 RepID=A0A4R6RJT3_9HYPH|nr:hypothetical protein [Oharaeibacter diazotrophicus]TDP86740.1 hypothetical protein EDD54_0621 [Oharaeibacter diazotrophicus]BBE71317.1 hypothetical protein OHA_1_00890 [Pleomorphomonas sp. SM30]GLS78073.1 hypothetical protein GCM10007904_34100 [Oharaeibacter diazotrophicus]